jgi:hypothetical protein
MDQAAGRVLRLGQKRQVDIHYIALEEEQVDGLINIDELMNEKVEMKRNMCREILDAAQDYITSEDMEDVPLGEAEADGEAEFAIDEDVGEDPS